MTNLPIGVPDRGTDLGEFIVDFPVPEGMNIGSLAVAEPVPRIWLGEFVSDAVTPDQATNGVLRTFIVVRNTGEPLTVRGHGLKRQNGTPYDPSAYAVF